MIEDGGDLALMLALKYLLQRLELKGVMSYPEIQRMLDEALGEIKRLRMDMARAQALTAVAVTPSVG